MQYGCKFLVRNRARWGLLGLLLAGWLALGGGIEARSGAQELETRPRSTPPAYQASAPQVSASGVQMIEIDAQNQGGKTTVRALLPTKRQPGAKFPVLYLLPVEAGDGNKYGDGLIEAQRVGIPDRWSVVCVAPTFFDLPWYANHPTNPRLQQESYFLEVVVPVVEGAFPVLRGPKSRYLVGFSKSGWGAAALLLRHPEQFAKAAAWDTPWMMDWPSRYGSQPIFGSEENFRNYQLSRLLERQAELLRREPRLLVAGQGNFQADTARFAMRLSELNIQQSYWDGPQRPHDWHSGWLADVVERLLPTRVP